jgi:hypothetical protein
MYIHMFSLVIPRRGDEYLPFLNMELIGPRPIRDSSSFTARQWTDRVKEGRLRQPPPMMMMEHRLVISCSAGPFPMC